MGAKKVTVRLTGRTPLVLHNNQCVNPRNPLKKQISAITSKGKRKTDADLDQLEKLEFLSSLYINDQIGPFVPAQNLRKMMIEAARKEKNGKQFESGAFVNDDAPILYDGPRDFEGMYANPDDFVWTTVCGNQSASIMRTRARFKQWAVEFEVYLEESLVTIDMLCSALNHAQISVGLCDGRSIGCGRFKWELVGELVEA
jgi:hypothetical protein